MAETPTQREVKLIDSTGVGSRQLVAMQIGPRRFAVVCQLCQGTCARRSRRLGPRPGEGLYCRRCSGFGLEVVGLDAALAIAERAGEQVRYLGGWDEVRARRMVERGA